MDGQCGPCIPFQNCVCMGYNNQLKQCELWIHEYRISLKHSDLFIHVAAILLSGVLNCVNLHVLVPAEPDI